MTLYKEIQFDFTHVCVYYSISTGLSLSTLTMLSTLTLTPVAELDCCLLTWLVNSSYLLFKSLVITVSLSILSLKRSLYSDCEVS